jgi:hypothetical protein
VIRRAAGGLLLAAGLAACGSVAPSAPPSPRASSAPPPAGTSAPPPTAPTPTRSLTLKDTGNTGLPLPPSQFDPATVPAFYYFTGDGRVGVWSGPLGRPDLAMPLVDPIPEADGSYGTATRFPDGSVVVPFASGDASTVLLLRAGDEPRVIVDRAGRAVGAAPGDGSFVVARTTGIDDDGIWKVWLDDREPVRVLPPVSRPELAGREGLVLSADGLSVAAAACPGQMQIRWAGQDAARVDFGNPVGFDQGGGLIAYGDCGRSRIFRTTGEFTDDVFPMDSTYQAHVTPDGRHLLFQLEATPGILGEVDLVTSQRGSSLLMGAGWDFVQETTDRYVVLRRDDGAGEVYRWTWAVHDLLEGWTGYFVVDTYPPAP